MRLFVALDIPEEVRRALTEWVARFRYSVRGPRWTRLEGLHVTLKFIGETPSERVGEIRAALASIRQDAPIELRFRGTGFFPNERHPRVFWAGIESGPALAALAESVERQLVPLGFPREARAFQPHLTLARFPSPKGLQLLREKLARASPAEFGTSRERQFHLYQSVLKPGGSEYTRLASFDFLGG